MNRNVIIGIVALVVIILAVMLFMPGNNQPTGEAPSTATPPATTEPAPATPEPAPATPAPSQ